MSRRVIIPLLIFSLAVNAAAAAALSIGWFRAKGGEPAFTWQGKRADSFFQEDLRLPESDARELRHLLAPPGHEMRHMRDDIRQHRSRLVDLISQPSPDRVAIDREIADIVALQSRMEREAADRLLALKAHLSPDRQERLMELLRSHACGGMGPGPWKGPGRGSGMHGGRGLRGRP